MSDADQGPERHINIHFSPEIMGGTYANFANVSSSDYEFTITFARVDHEVEEEEIPGVVVSRVNLSHRFVRELSDALEDACRSGRRARASRTCPSWATPTRAAADPRTPDRERLLTALASARPRGAPSLVDQQGCA